MNELFFNWHKSLNIKKVIITAIITITLILIILFFIKVKTKTEAKDVKPINTTINNPETNSTLFLNTDFHISLELSNTYGLKQYIPINDYLLELRSDSNLNIFLSNKNFIEGKVFKDIVDADKLAFTESFKDISNISEVKELNINGNTAYTYSFHYLDTNLNTSFYIQITWLEIDNNYYIFDIEFPLDNLQSYPNIIMETLSSFKTQTSISE